MCPKSVFKFNSIITGIILLLGVLPLYAQTTADISDAEPTTDTAEAQEKGDIKITSTVLENLKEKLPAETFAILKTELKDKDVFEKELPAILEGLNLSSEALETVSNYLQTYTEFVKKIRKAAPIILSMNQTGAEIRKKEKEVKNATSEEEKVKITKKIDQLTKQLKELDNQVTKITEGIQPSQLEQLPDILAYEGYQDHIDTILKSVQNQVQFAEKINTLDTIIESIDTLKKDILQKEAEQKKAQTEDEKAKITEELERMSTRLQELEHNFTILISGVDPVVLYKKKADEDIDWNKELKKIFSPIMVGLKGMTERPRRMEALRSEMMHYKSLIPQLKQAVRNIQKLRKDIKGQESIDKRLREAEEFWVKQEKEFTGKLKTAQDQIAELQKDQMTLSEGVEYFFETVIKHRGKNIILSALAFLVIYVFFHFMRILLMKLNPLRRFPKYAFIANFIDVIFYLFTFIASTGAMILVLYITGDWLILGIVIILLVGVIWAARNTLPQFAEQIKLLLGFGPVRERERIIYDGIPYRVESMGIYTYLKNPLLTGGTLRLPIKDAIGMRSRPYDEAKEPWFPCKEGDWVLINGETWRHVISQTPQWVKVTAFNMEESVSTSSFLSQTICNLSASPCFWLGIVVYLDYKHRHQVEEITQKLTETLTREIQRICGEEKLISPWVELAELTDASLGFWLWVQMKPEAASEYGLIKQFYIPRAALKAANTYGWELIRFTHVNLRQPETTKRVPSPHNEKS